MVMLSGSVPTSMMGKRLMVVGFGLLGLVLATPLQAAQVTLPAYPYWANPTFRVNQTTLDEAAGEWCSEQGTEGDPLEFFYGSLALDSLDALCQDSLTDAQRDKLLGNLYISGYFGGVWLRDALQDTPALNFALPHPLYHWADGHTSKARAHVYTHTIAANGTPAEFLVFQSMTAEVANTRRTAERGTDQEVIDQNYLAIPELLYLYGYNLGYIEVLYANPPEGVELPENALVCGDYLLDCTSPDIDFQALTTYQAALISLQNPPDEAWAEMAEQVITYGESSVQSGIETWEAILEDNTISSSAFLPLIDLSVGYLLVSDAAVLASMTSYADELAADGRCALHLQAGLSLWSGAYFMGLAADDPEGTAPTLSCE